MSNKITANFGADVSEVEAKMLQATRATKAYERAVNGIAKTEARASSERMASMSTLERGLKGLSTKFSGKELFGNLASGLGIGGGMQIAQKGAELISKYWKSAAESAEKIADASTRAADSVISRITGNRTNAQQLAVEKQKMDMVEMIALQAELKAGSETATNADKEAAAEARAKAEELRTSIAKRKKQEDQAAASKKKHSEDEQKSTNKSLTEQINAIDEKRAEEKRTDEERLARLDKEIALRKADKAGGLENTLKLKQAEDKRAELAEKIAEKKTTLEEDVGDVIAMIADQQKKNDEEAIERAKELADERKKAFSETSAKNKAAFGDKLAAEGYDVGEDGKLRRGNVVVSEADAARTMATKDRNARFTAVTKRQQIKDTGRIGEGEKGKTEGEKLLAKIEAYLRPTNVSST